MLSLTKTDSYLCSAFNHNKVQSFIVAKHLTLAHSA